MNSRKYIACLCLCYAASVAAQTLVYLEHSETLSFDQERIANAQILRGNVIFRHEDALMYCDSAYFYDQENSLDAFGHVRFEQGDTLKGYGDKLFYDGNTKLARLRRHVRLVHGKEDNPTVLTTDSLNYDRGRDVAYYYSGGTIADSLNTLRSVRGKYYPNSKQAVFSQDVRLDNPKFILTSDTLLYNTATKIADLVSPSTIVYEEETNIYSSLGWYNTETEQSMLLRRSQVIHSDGKSMTGDTIYYDKHIGHGRIIGNMEMRDTVQKMTLYGNFGEMFNDGDYGYATDSALAVDWSEEDYAYLHADTLYTETIYFRPDSTEQDNSYRKMRAYHNVRLYRVDLQAVCDSLDYNSLDSVMTLYTDPVCWSDANQMSADTMRVYMKDGVVDYAHGINNAITIKREARDYFNQMAGKEMFAYVRDGELRQVDVNGNALTVFYPKQEDGTFFGMNTTQSSYVKVFLENQEIHHIVILPQPQGVIYPMDQIPAGKDKLAGFFWAEQERPLKPGDVFLRPARTPRPGSGAISATEEVEMPMKSEEIETNTQKTEGKMRKRAAK